MCKYWMMAAVIFSAFSVTLAVDSLALQISRKGAPRDPVSLDVSAASSPQSIRSKEAVLEDAGEDLSPCLLDVAGIINPKLVPAQEAGLRDYDIVIGVSAFGVSHAFLRSKFDKPTSHIVTSVMGSVPVTITHCNRTRRTRVLTCFRPGKAANIRCGGWLADQEMGLLVDDLKNVHSSAKIPLQDLPFVVTTWKKWRQEHPKSVVYLGDEVPASNPS